MTIIKTIKLLPVIIIFVMMASCKTQSLENSAPFSIVEKSYFDWVGGKQGTQGTTIRIEGTTQSLNVSFSKVFFQEREYDIVPQFNGESFFIEGNFSEFREREVIMDKDPAAEVGNKTSDTEKQFPFDLEEDQAILLYSVNGREGYYKISDLKKMDKVYRP